LLVFKHVLLFVRAEREPDASILEAIRGDLMAITWRTVDSETCMEEATNRGRTFRWVKPSR
jgi:hypothetical protein